MTTKERGRYLVADKLCQKGWVLIRTINDEKSKDWQFNDVGKELELDISELANGIQKAERKKLTKTKKDLICVFVRLTKQNKDEFYILNFEKLQKIVCDRYNEARFKDERPNNPKSHHALVSPEDLKEYKDNWEIITKR